MLTFRCPDVGLEFCTFRCPEVGLEFLLDAPPRKQLDRKYAKELLRRCVSMGGGSKGRVRPGRKVDLAKINRGAATRLAGCNITYYICIYMYISPRGLFHVSKPPSQDHTFLDILNNTKNIAFSLISTFAFVSQDISFYFCHTSAAKCV